MEYLLIILAFVAAIIGIIGSVLPGLPGLPVSYIGVLLFHFSHPKNHIAIWVHVVLILLVIIVSVLDYVIPIVGTKKFGGSKYGAWGSTIGLIVGLFFGFLGMIIGPFIGAFVFELIFHRQPGKALKSAFGSFIGFLLSTGIKIILSLIFLGFICIKTLSFAFG